MRDPASALEDVVKTGADRILTSGGAASAEQGADRLARLVRASAGRIVIMACGAIRATNVAEVLKKTGAREIHSARATPVASPMRFRHELATSGSVGGAGDQRFVVGPQTVAAVLAAAAKATP